MQSILEIPAAAASGREARATIRAPWIIPQRRQVFPARQRNVPLMRIVSAMQSTSELPADPPVSARRQSVRLSAASVSRQHGE